MDRPAAVAEWQDMGHHIKVAGYRIFCVDTNSHTGEVVFVLHGFPSSSFDWREVVPLVARKRRVVTFDFLGYGLSDKPADGPFSLFAQTQIAEAVADQMGVRSAVLVSHDMGDTVAAELLMRHQEGRLGFDVTRAILTNGSIFIDMAQLSDGQQMLLSLPDEALAEPLPLDGMRPGLRETFGRQPDEAELDAMVWLLSREGGDRLLPRLIRYIEERRANQERFTQGLVGFAGPLTALWGELDPIAVVAMTDRLKELRPDTEVVRWPDLGHWPSIEDPARVAAAIVERF